MKFLKHISFAMIITSVIFGCDPLDDVYTELDELEEEAGVDAGKTIARTLSSDDYGVVASTIRSLGTAQDSSNADFVAVNEAFSADIAAKDYLGAFVNDEYPQFGAGAAVQITYNLFTGDLPDFDPYINGNVYEFDIDDYTSITGSFPEPYDVIPGDIIAANEIPTILTAGVTSPSEGDIYLVSYNQTESTSVPDPVAIFREVGEGEDVSGLTDVDITFASADYQSLVDHIQTLLGTDWIDDFGTLEYFYGANSFFENFDARVDEENNGSDNSRKNWISENNLEDDIFDGSTTYTEDSTRVEARIREGILKYLSLTYSDETPGDNRVFNVTFDVFYGDMGSGFVTNTLSFSAVHSGEYELGTVDQEEIGVFYTYDGSEWTPTEGVIHLNASDYDAMGTESGQPGRFDNFSEDAAPGSYLPEYLNGLLEFSQEGDNRIIVYDYFNGSGTSTLAEIYTFTEGAWTGSFYETRTDQFVHDGTEFVFDPSVVVFMTSDDYQIIVDVVRASNPELINSFETAEDLYGADAFFENFDIRATSREGQADYDGLSAAEVEALIAQRVNEGIEVFLEIKFAEAEPVEGLQVLYTVNYATYDGTDGTGVAVYELVGTGEFELVEDSE